MRETSYHVVITEMTVRALWETQNVLDCIPDALWDIRFGGAPVWQHIYHMLHELDQWFINPDDPDFVEPPVHHPHLQNLSIYPQPTWIAARLMTTFIPLRPSFHCI